MERPPVPGYLARPSTVADARVICAESSVVSRPYLYVLEIPQHSRYIGTLYQDMSPCVPVYVEMTNEWASNASSKCPTSVQIPVKGKYMRSM